MIPAVRTFSFYLVVLFSLWLGMPGYAAAAAEAGIVSNVEGQLVAKGMDGVLRPLALGQKVFAGDILFTGKDSHARIKFADGGLMLLKPGTQFKIENFNFDASQPKADQASFNLFKGSLRAVSGLVGKRGNPDSYGVKTQAATIGIRGTNFGLILCKGDCADIPTKDGLPLEDGLHVDVSQGVVQVSNAAGLRLVQAGEFSFVANAAVVPVEIPKDKGTSVEVPPAMMVDKVRGLGQGKDATSTPNTCPAN